MERSRCVHVLVAGRVQGVWFRGWTVQTAQALGLDGWVRNLSDGRVEAVFRGPEAVVDAMLAHCRQGPPSARVTGLAIGDCHELPDRGFHQRATV